jgi:hypothetical protein
MAVSCHTHALAAFISWQRAVRYAFVQWLGGHQNRSGRFAEETDHLLLLGVEKLFLGRSIHSLLTIPTAVSQLFCLHEADICACYWQTVVVSLCSSDCNYLFFPLVEFCFFEDAVSKPLNDKWCYVRVQKHISN